MICLELFLERGMFRFLESLSWDFRQQNQKDLKKELNLPKKNVCFFSSENKQIFFLL